MKILLSCDEHVNFARCENFKTKAWLRGLLTCNPLNCHNWYALYFKNEIKDIIHFQYFNKVML